VAYLHCPHCDRTAWLAADAGPAPHCRHCAAPLAPMPARRAHLLAAAVRERFARDIEGDALRPRFVRR